MLLRWALIKYKSRFYTVTLSNKDLWPLTFLQVANSLRSHGMPVRLVVTIGNDPGSVRKTLAKLKKVEDLRCEYWYHTQGGMLLWLYILWREEATLHYPERLMFSLNISQSVTGCDVKKYGGTQTFTYSVKSSSFLRLPVSYRQVALR